MWELITSTNLQKAPKLRSFMAVDPRRTQQPVKNCFIHSWMKCHKPTIVEITHFKCKNQSGAFWSINLGFFFVHLGIVWDYIKKVCRCLLYIVREYSNAAKAWAFTRHESESDGIRIFGIRKHLVAIPSKSTIYWKYGWSKNMVFTIVFSRFLQRQDLRQSATKQACLPKEAHPIEQPFWMVPNHGVNPLWKTMVNTGGCKKIRGWDLPGDAHDEGGCSLSLL